MSKKDNVKICSYAGITGEVDNTKKLISNVKKHFEQGKVSVQRALIGIMMHAVKHKDWTPGNHLIEAMGASGQQRKAVNFLEKFAGLEIGPIEKDGKQVMQFVGWKGVDHIKANFEEAKRTIWCGEDSESLANAFSAPDINVVIRNFYKKLAKIQADEKISAADKAKCNSILDQELLRRVTTDAGMQLIEAANSSPTEGDGVDLIAANG